MKLLIKIIKNKIVYPLVIAGLSLTACGGSTLGGLSNSGTENAGANPGTITQSNNGADNSGSTNSSSDNSGSTQAAAPTAQPTQPAVIGIHLLVLNGTVVLPGQSPDPDCGKNDKHPSPFTSIPTVKVLEKIGGNDWFVRFVLAKKETEADNILPDGVDRCGNFNSRVDLTIGPNPNECNGDTQIKFVASYRDASGIFYNTDLGSQHVFSCKDSPNYPDALIKLQPLPLMLEMPVNTGATH